MKKLLIAIISVVMMLSVAAVFTACPKNIDVGISMPDAELARWQSDADYLQAEFEKEGYTVEQQIADGTTAMQISQIEGMIAKNVKVLIISAIDSKTLLGVLTQARAAGVIVIAYDRMLMDTPNVDYYCSFDGLLVGVAQAEFIVDALDLENATEAKTIEIFNGSDTDANAKLFYDGAMSVLKPYLDDGSLVVKSGKTAFLDCATEGWKAAVAQARMDTIIANQYAGTEVLDAVLCANDSTALGCSTSLKENYIKAGRTAYPVITGQDCELGNVALMIKDRQSMSVFKDLRVLAKNTKDLVLAVLADDQTALDKVVNDKTNQSNGKKIVPSYIGPVESVTKANYVEKLVTSGYYTQKQIDDQVAGLA